MKTTEKVAVFIKTKHGKSISCPNPTKCKGNIRTTWNSHQDLAIAEWNNLIDTFVNGKGQ